ncbi:mediator complex subunit 29 [Phyllostomus discolor]|uniref:Mediator of RNA polymerase II transcription subunit 29 n=1 Tax=Phyllostomus discolor TaxID=89673 RepID=A0A834DFD1_9CHIR|nr:mediator complex subunit 29 [Phyllostomus discolor]
MAASQQQVSAASSAAGVSGPGSAGGPGTQQQPQPPTQLVGSAQSGLLQQQQQDFDPVQRYKMLIPQLKESLQVLKEKLEFEKPGSGGKRLAHECLSQSCDSAKHSPLLVPTATKPDAVQPDSQPYPQYLALIKAQIACAKDIHTALLDCANKVTGKTPAPPTGPGGAL